MQDIPQEQLNKRFQLLPESLQDAIFSEQTSDAIRKTCVLREAEEHMSSVALLAGNVLLGYLRPELLAAEIRKETGMEEMKAQHITHDIDMEVFANVRLELKKLYPPTIQTPNVQMQGFSPAKISGGNLGGQALPAKPKYVISIPEKYQNRSFPGIPAQPAPVTKEIPSSSVVTPIAAPAPQTPPPPATSYKFTPLGSEASPSGLPASPESVPVATPRQEAKAPEIQKPIAEKKPGTLIIPQAQPAPISPIAAPEKKSEQPTVNLSSPPLPKSGEKQSQPGPKIAQTVEPAGVKMNPIVPLPTFIGSGFQQPSEDAVKDSEQKIKEMASKFAVSSTAQQKLPQESAYKEKLDAAKKPGTVDLSKF